ncbi:DUF2938 domain-containing protein [Methylophaga lonarensis]|uniref:DUF2938 domain-containing protein n=1 Tax=Methylophaga lonarensis TaxID=999151 RepID=UPI003D2A9FF7
MSIEGIYLVKIIAVGIGATVIMDLWALMLRRVFKVMSLNFCLVGRWLIYMRDGVFRHKSITSAQARPAECAVGWLAHYAIGIVFAFALLLMTSPSWLDQPTILPALLTGLVTISIPFFIMQPAFGMGIAAAKTPKPGQARLRSLMTHSVFGLGLYLSALVLSIVFQGS